MNFQYTPYIIPLVIGSAICFYLAWYSWFHRKAAGGAIALALLALLIGEWLAGYALEIAGADLPTKIIWGKAQYIGITLVPMMWLIFALNHANQSRRVTHRNMLLMTIVPFLTILLVLISDGKASGVRSLVWTEMDIIQANGFSVLNVSHGPWFWVHSAYSYLLILAGTLVVIRSVGRMQGLYRRQAAALLFAVLTPWVSNIVYLSGLSPIPYLDITPFAFALTAIALTWAIFGFRLIDLTPLARDILINEMQDAMLVLDAQGCVADINPAAQRLLGKPADQVIGRPAGEIIRLWPQYVERYQNTLEALDEVAIGDGEEQRWYELRLFPLFDHQKRLIGRAVVVRDITKRKHAEEQLRQLSRAVEASPASIVITDPNGAIEYVNPKFTKVTGYTMQEALGKNPRILKTEYTPPEVHRQLWETLLLGNEWRGEFCNRKKSGEIYWEFASISPILDSTGKVTHYVAVKEDITERKQAEEALLLARDQALEASRLKSQLLAKVSHELRTPLGSILGYTELLNGGAFGSLNEPQKQATANILNSTNYLNTLISELLDQAQIEARTLLLNNQTFSPAALLERVQTTISVLAQNKGLTFSVSQSPDLPEVIYGDERRLQQIIINLVSNAVKFTPAGEVRLSLLRPNPVHWAIQVTDTGIGIPAEAQNYIFEPFRQADTSITHENRGTGLGLSIARQLVEMMGGRITLDSEVDKGSTFTVILPILKRPE